MARAFISYSWEDREIAQKIAEHLKQDGAEIWIDYATLKGGQRFPERINQALDWCDSLILIWSKSAAASYYVGLEWHCALDLQKTIIPCLIDDTQRPNILRGFHYIDFKNFDDAYEQLLLALDLTHKTLPEKQKPIRQKPPEKPDRIETERAKEQKREAQATIPLTDNVRKKQKIIKIAALVVTVLVIAMIGNYAVNRMTSKDKPGREQVVKQSPEDSLKIFWEERQSEMNLRFQQAQQVDGDAGASSREKVQSWQKFLTDFSSDNPFSEIDNVQLKDATIRRNYWRNIVEQDSHAFVDKSYWEKRQSEMNSSYQQALKSDNNASLSADAKARIWQDFMVKYGDDNPYSQLDNDQHIHANERKTHWTNILDEQQKPVTPAKEKIIKGMTLVLIPGDTFDMGDTFGDGEADEKPVHSVTVSNFYMGNTEVTNAQFAAFLNEFGKDKDVQGNTLIYQHDWGIKKSGNRWQPQPGYENHPMVRVTWYGATQYAKWAGCRLPTEAEWEYAAREGGKKIKWSGTNNQNSLGEYAWYESNSGGKTHPVGTKKPNALGLYDMSGNVWEWCSDWYDENYYKSSPKNNPKGPASGTYRPRTLRGGSWYDIERYCRSSNRDGGDPGIRGGSIGFRVARDSPQ